MSDAPKLFKITAKTATALQIVKENPNIRPNRFSELMWKDSPSHRKMYNCGHNGATRGRGIWRSAGGYLGKLAAKGLIRRRYNFEYETDEGYHISSMGESALELWRKEFVDDMNAMYDEIGRNTKRRKVEEGFPIISGGEEVLEMWKKGIVDGLTKAPDEIFKSAERRKVEDGKEKNGG